MWERDNCKLPLDATQFVDLIGEIEFRIRESDCNLNLIKVKYDINKGEKKRKLQYQQDPGT